MKVRFTLHFAAALLLAFTTAAQAELRSFKFVGTVIQSLPLAPAGAKVVGTFAYDTDTPATFVNGETAGPGYGQADYFIERPIKVKVNGHNVTSPFFYVTVINNLGGNA